MLVSLIVPVYNVEKYLKQCIESILSQTYHEIEVICVDDGSQDQSLQILKEYAGFDKRIKIIENEHQGLVMTRKTGVNIATGEYIGFVDSDDWIEPTLVEKAVACIQNNDVDIFSYNYWYKYDKRVSLRRSVFENGIYANEQLQDVYNKMMFDFEYGCPAIAQSIWSKIVKKELIRQTMKDIPVEISYGEDAAITYCMLLKAKRIAITNEAFYNYRIRSDSMCQTKDIKKFQEIRIFQEYLEKKFAVYDESYQLQKQLKAYMMLLLSMALQNNFQITTQPGYLVDKKLLSSISKYNNIALYGAGNVGKSYYQILKNDYEKNVSLWIDKKKCGQMSMNKKLSAIEELDNGGYEIIIIALADKNSAQSVKKELIQRGVSKEKIFWEYPIADWSTLLVSF